MYMYKILYTYNIFEISKHVLNRFSIFHFHFNYYFLFEVSLCLPKLEKLTYSYHIAIHNKLPI